MTATVKQTRLTSEFVEGLREPRTSYISPARVCTALGVPANRLAALTGIHRNTMRNPASERLQTKLREMVKAVAAAAELTGDVNQAVYWYRNEPIGDFGYKTAAELVAGGHVDAVLSYLNALENGAGG